MELITNIEKVRKELPTPCVGTDCTTWVQARSIDLGRCSVEIPYGKIKPFGPSPLLKEVGHKNLQLAELLLDGILKEAKFNRIVREGGGGVRVTLKPDYEKSSWWVSSENDELCIDARVDFSHRVIRGLLFIPISRRCVDRPLSIELCGKISISSGHRLEWNTTSLDVQLLGNYSECKSRVINGVRNKVESKVTGASNTVSQELTRQLGGALTVSGEQLYKFAEAADKNKPEHKKTTIKLLELLNIRKTCSNPKPFPGRKANACFGSVAPGRCVEDDTKNTSTGSCVIETPIQRIESTPTGLEVILADYEGKGHNDWIWQWTHGSLGSLIDVKLLNTIRDFSCIKASKEDAKNAQTPSRFYERLFRGPQKVQLGGSRP